MTTLSVPSKRRLRNAMIWINKFHSGLQMMYDDCLWKVDNFYGMKDDQEHASPITNKGQILMFVKKRCDLKVILFAPDGRSNFVSRIVYGEGQTSAEIKAKKVAIGVHEAQFPSAALKDKKNHLLRKGQFALQLKIGPKILFIKLPCISISKEQDQKALAFNLLESRRDVKFGDFVIVVENKKYQLHKAILAARSIFFRNLFVCDPEASEMKLSTTGIVFRYVVGYIYTCSLSALTERDRFEVLRLAVRLKIMGLINLCSLNLMELMNETNVHEIRHLGDSLNVRILVIAADYFLHLKEQKTSVDNMPLPLFSAV